MLISVVNIPSIANINDQLRQIIPSCNRLQTTSVIQKETQCKTGSSLHKVKLMIHTKTVNKIFYKAFFPESFNLQNCLITQFNSKSNDPPSET